MNEEIIRKTEEFSKQEFQNNPHYSFNDWSVMYNHSLKVRDIALKIAEDIPCDKMIISICSLLHDIGKTFKTDSETLRKSHEDFNFLVSEKFLDSLELSSDQLKKVKEVISNNSDSVEKKIVEDADTLAFYADKRLYMLFIQWAKDNNLNNAAQQKIDKFSKLNFEISKEIGKDWYEQIKKDWAF